MKYMESNQICVNVVSLPVGTAHEISERVGETNKIKIAAAAFLNRITQK